MSSVVQRCVERALRGIWSPLKLRFICFVILILGSEPRRIFSLNLEGSILLIFRANIESDPYNSLANWNSNDHHPCNWLGVHCADGKVRMLLNVLGTIPTEFERLTLLEVLNLRDNNLTGTIPAEISKLVSLKRLLLCNNNFEGLILPEVAELSALSELRYDGYLGSVNNRKVDLWLNGVPDSGLGLQDSPINLESSYGPNLIRKAHGLAALTRHQLAEQSSNVEAVPDKGINPGDQVTSQPIFRSSGSFPATGTEKGPLRAAPSPPSYPNFQQVNKPCHSSHTEKGRPSHKLWVDVPVALGVAFLIAVAIALFFLWRSRGAKAIGPFKTGISGQLQKAFVIGDFLFA